MIEFYAAETVYANLKQVGILPTNAPKYLNHNEAFNTTTKYILKQPSTVLALIQKNQMSQNKSCKEN